MVSSKLSSPRRCFWHNAGSRAELAEVLGSQAEWAGISVTVAKLSERSP